MFVTGPNVVKTVTNEDVSLEELGGAETHASKSGIAHFIYENEIETLLNVRKLLSFLPLNYRDKSPELKFNQSEIKPEPKLDNIIPDNPSKPYDMRKIINLLVDDNDFFEVHKNYAENILCGFSRIGGMAIGIIANQPAVLA